MDKFDEYRRLKGRIAPTTVSVGSPSVDLPVLRQAPKPITPKERARAERMRAIVMQKMPEFIPFIRDAVANGMIDGWRNIDAHEIEK